MTRRVIVEVVLEAEVQDEEQLLSQCLANFRAADWSDDPSGAALARLEEQLRANLDQVGLQNIIRPSCLLDDIAGVAPTGAATVTVRDRPQHGALPFERS